MSLLAALGGEEASGPGLSLEFGSRAFWRVGPMKTLKECVAITIFWPSLIGLVWLSLTEAL